MLRHRFLYACAVLPSFLLLLALFAFWLLLSGLFTAFLVSAGAVSALAVVWFTRRMDLLDATRQPIRFGPRILLYWAWLLKEIAKSAWQVSRIILSPRLPISPTLVRFRPTQTSGIGLVVHANSITLTPGTITVEIEDGHFLVHGLTRASADGVIDSEMDRRISALEARR